MSRWYWKRAVLAVVAGFGTAGGATAEGPEKKPAGAQPNDVIVIKTAGKPDQKVTIVRSTRQADGRVLTEVKDANGQTFTMIDNAPNGSVDKSDITQAGGTDGALPKAKPRPNDLPSMSAVAAADSKRWKLFGKSEKNEAPEAPPAPAPNEPAKKPSLFSRVFGSKKKDEMPQGQQPPPAQAYAPPAPQPSYVPPPQPSYVPPPAYAGQPSFAPAPAFAPSQYGTPPNFAPQFPPARPPVAIAPPVAPGVPSQMPTGPQTDLAPWNQVRSPIPVAPPTPLKTPTPAIMTGTTRINLTAEPPTAKPPTVTAPTVTAPVVTAPIPVAPERPAVPTAPSFPAVPAIPVAPSFPSIPAVPAVPVPSFPTPIPAPGPQSKAKPSDAVGVQTVGYSKPTAAVRGPLDELKPQVSILQNGLSAAERQMAARVLAGGHYGSRAEVKAILYTAAHDDVSPEVRACCIEQLCELAYFEPSFLKYLGECAEDKSETVRRAAAKALAKMKPTR